MRERESEERQGDGDVEVGGRRVERELVMLGERQRYEPMRLLNSTKKKTPPTNGNQSSCPLYMVEPTMPSRASS